MNGGGVPSNDRFWIQGSVSDPEGDAWTYNAFRAKSGVDTWQAPCSEDPVHGCIWYYDNGECGRETIYVTVKDSHGNVSNEDVLYADYFWDTDTCN
jgi:hypothetical protein